VGVGPLEGEGAVETLDLAVGLRPVGAGVFVDDVAQRLIEQRRPVAGPIVAEDAFGSGVGLVESGVDVARATAPIIMVSNLIGVSFQKPRWRRCGDTSPQSRQRSRSATLVGSPRSDGRARFSVTS
jgi:hypothetical protein